MSKKIRFKGQEYILVEGAITTPEDFSTFAPSFAHLFGDGKIRRYGDIIGEEKDIEYLGEVKTEVKNFDNINHPQWFSPPKKVKIQKETK